ncbi:MAG: glutamine synthetase adenylyltransferase [Anaerolineae bacterium]
MHSVENVRQLILDEQLAADEARNLLEPIGFRDPAGAAGTLRRMAGNLETRPALADSLPALLLALSEAAHPDRVLVNLERFTRRVEDRPALFRLFAANPRAIEILVTLFAGSQFLTEILLRTPEYFERLVRHQHLARSKSPADFKAGIQVARAGSAHPEQQLDALRRLQRWELLRIGACDLLGLLDLPTVTAQLSLLAEGLIRACLDIAAEGSNTSPDGFAVIGMGKLGGGELNYSSDIDLLFLAGSEANSYRRLGERLIDNLTRVTAEGFLYRVDMRLRPWGKVGALVTSVDGHLAYLRRQARLWEKQALLKARLIAGDQEVGQRFLQAVQPLIFETAGEVVRSDVRAMKDRIESYLQEWGREWGEVKLGQGSIRDIEFVTQYLQLAHGDTHPEVRSPNTLEALAQLAASGLLAADDYRVLADGYTFLRPVEHWLQMMHYRQTHTLPTDPEELAHLARRLGFQGSGAGAKFVAGYEQHSAAIRAVYQRHLGLDEPDPAARSQSPTIQSHLARLSPSYSEVFSQKEIERHAALAARIEPDNLAEVEAAPLEDGRWRVTIVGYDYLGELSLICGLMFIHGLNIIDGNVFTYRPAKRPQTAAPARRPRPAQAKRPDARPKIVDVFTVRPIKGGLPPGFWSGYSRDLNALLQKLEHRQQQQVQGELARRFAAALSQFEQITPRLYPIEIEIDNRSSDRSTVLHIDSTDTVGFLYEFTNALALNGLYIVRVTIETSGDRIQDTLYITDSNGRKITSPARQQELRAAVVLIKHFTHLLPHSPNPESALLHFRQFLAGLFSRPNWPDELASVQQPRVLDALAHLLGVSDFLWNDFLRMQHANLFPVVREVEALATAKSKRQLAAELEAALAEAPDGATWGAALNAFKDREMFRIDMRKILGHITEFGQFAAELTDLAEVVVQAAYALGDKELRARFGAPLLEDGRPCPLSLCALGKCGGRELGFASDIELIFIYGGPGQTSGPEVITTTDYFERLVLAVTNAIQAKREGIFEIDLRLRPYGRAGSRAVSLESFRRYFAADGDAWAYERQALVKLRPIAGDAAFGRQVVALRDRLVYSDEPFDAASMRGMRERQIRHLVKGGTINAKHSPGGLVDAEYLVQGLQITHGRHNPALRSTNTREAMAALKEAGVLAPDDYAQLRAAFDFLRQLINALRVVRGNAWDLTVPPANSQEFAFLARRLDYGDDLARLSRDLGAHTSFVRKLSARLLG